MIPLGKLSILEKSGLEGLDRVKLHSYIVKFIT